MKRTSSGLLSSILPRTTQTVLAATILRPEKEWYLSDLAHHLHVTPSSMQRLLPRLTKAGILIRRTDGNRVYYQADTACPIFKELTAILTKTVGIVDPLRDALRPLASKISLAFVHGSMVNASERTESDIDLILVGSVTGLELSRILPPLDKALGRQVNPTHYSMDEFRRKIHSANHFLLSVLKKPKLFIIGDEHELKAIAE